MITLIWLCVWLTKDTPTVDYSGQWNNWAVSFVVCVVIDFIWAVDRS